MRRLLLSLALCVLALSVVFATTYSDSFTEGSDTALTSHTPDSAGSWSEVIDSAGTVTATVIAASDELSPNVIAADANAAYIASWTPFSADYSLTMKWANTTGDNLYSGCMLARYADANNFYAMCVYRAAAATDVRVTKRVSGTYTNLLSLDCGPADGDVMKFELTGTALAAYKNGVLCTAGSTTDASLAAKGSVGIGFGHFRTGAAADDVHTDVDVDDFTLIDAGVSAVTRHRLLMGMD